MKFVAVQNGGWCSCGNSYGGGAYKKLPGSKCDKGGINPGLGRGGSWANAVYHNTATYVGCYTDNSHRNMKHGPKRYVDRYGQRYNANSCALDCKGFKYIALQNNGWCSCDNGYGTNPANRRRVGYHHRPDHECDRHGEWLLPGSARRRDGRVGMGAGWRNSIYKVNEAVNIYDTHIKVKYGKETNYKGDSLDTSTLRGGMDVELTPVNGKKCYATGNHGDVSCRANAHKAHKATSTFTVVDAGRGHFAFRNGALKKYCADEHNRWRCNRNRIGQWERFMIYKGSKGGIIFKGGRSNFYNFCQWVGPHAHNGIRCNTRTRNNSRMEFKVKCVGHCKGKDNKVMAKRGYIGCYGDSGTRVMRYGPKNYNYHTPELCGKVCFRYKFIALQNGGWCSCDNVYKRSMRRRSTSHARVEGRRKLRFGQKASDKWCDNKGVHKGYGKGGPWLNAVYKNQQMVSTKVESLKKRGYMGCYADHGQRVFSMGPKRYGYTPEKCMADSRCKDKKYIALQNGGWCSCDNHYSTTKGVNWKQHNSPVRPDGFGNRRRRGRRRRRFKAATKLPDAWCKKNWQKPAGYGGPWTNAVYRNKKYQPHGYVRNLINKDKYIGCFADNGHRVFQYGPKRYGYNANRCKNACKPFKYVALQNGGWCSCDNSYKKRRNENASIGHRRRWIKAGAQIDVGQCNRRFRGGGGGWANAVYRNDKWEHEKHRLNPAKTGYVGCFTDSSQRTFRFGPKRYGYGDWKRCASACKQYKYIALQNGGWCSCDDVVVKGNWVQQQQINHAEELGEPTKKAAKTVAKAVEPVVAATAVKTVAKAVKPVTPLTGVKAVDAKKNLGESLAVGWRRRRRRRRRRRGRGRAARARRCPASTSAR